jgi:hypothetical protein
MASASSYNDLAAFPAFRLLLPSSTPSMPTTGTSEEVDQAGRLRLEGQAD